MRPAFKNFQYNVVWLKILKPKPMFRVKLALVNRNKSCFIHLIEYFEFIFLRTCFDEDTKLKSGLRIKLGFESLSSNCSERQFLHVRRH